MFTHTELLEIQLFLGLLFPWDDEGSQLYKAVSWTFAKKEGDQGFANFAAQDLDSLVKLIRTRAGRVGANVYVALGTQRMASVEKFTTDGFPAAVRRHNNIVSFKSVYLDIDVGKEKAYATTEDAFAALDDFTTQTGLPIPTMEVASGSGGLHVYWCTDKPIPIANWLPLATALRDAALAYGLKFDPQVTVNPAGILRVPNTWNHKKTPPTRVRLYHDEDHTFPQYGYQQLVSALQQFTGLPPRMSVPGSSPNRERTKNFQSGMESAPPVSIDDVAINCMVLTDILDRAGAGDAEPLWNQAIYAAAFTSDPHDAAHRLSFGDSRYTHAETEKKLAEKIAARADPKAGWPTCQSFSVLHPGCATCPMFALQKTPFHHAQHSNAAPPPPPPPGANGGASQPGGAPNDPLMPDKFWRRPTDNHVMCFTWNKAKNSYEVTEVINYPILDAGLDDDGTLLYLARIGGVEQWREINVANTMQPAQAASAMAKGKGCYTDPNHHITLRNFLVAWVNHLQRTHRPAHQCAYGWQDNGSFAYAGKIFTENGAEDAYRGRKYDPNFHTEGDLKPWQNAMQMIYGNMPLETVVASAFAGPLIELLGTSSMVMSIYSAESGVGKTTAMALAQGVWGHPRGGMSTLADTTNSMMKRISDLKSLPIYWDELRTKDQLEKVIDIVFQVTQGKSRARLNKDATQQDAPIFTTMFVVASNYGLADTVFSQTEATNAGGLRVLELQANGQSKIIGGWQAGQLMRGLEKNFGNAGALYAQWLAQNKKAAMQALELVREDLQTRLGLEPKERFWSTSITALMVGAMLANHLELTTFDLDRLRAYLEKLLQDHRGDMQTQDFATMQQSSDVLGLLQEMVSAIRHKHLIITETIPMNTGRPMPIKLIDTDITRLQEVWFQSGEKDGRLRVHVRPFNAWLRERRLHPRTVIDKLRAYYHITQGKQTLGAGVAGLSALSTIGRAECYDFQPIAASFPNPDSDEPS